jgi:hypothetical protein
MDLDGEEDEMMIEPFLELEEIVLQDDMPQVGGQPLYGATILCMICAT